MKLAKTLTAAVTVVAVVAVAVVVGLIFISSGAFNVAATEPESPLSEWVLSTTMDNSVHSRAKAVQVPADYDQLDLRAGLQRYAAMCMLCHGAPGAEASEVARGLNPDPPPVEEIGGDWSPAEVYWITRNGVKMTGMPAFGPTNTDKQLWQMTAFVKRLADMTPDQYQAFIAQLMAEPTDAAP